MIVATHKTVQELNFQADAMLTGNWLLGLRISQQAQALATQTQDMPGLGWALRYQGMFLIRLGRYDEAIGPLEYGLELSRKITDVTLEIGCLRSLGSLHFKAERFEPALHVLQQAIDLGRQLNNRSEEAHSVFIMARLHSFMAQFETARDLFQQSLNLFRDLNDHSGIVSSLNNIAEIFNEFDQIPQALQHYQEAQALALQADITSSLWIARGGIGVCHAKQGNFSAAVELLEPVFAMALERQNRDLQLFCGPYLGFALSQTSDVLAGQAILVQSLTLAQSSQSHLVQARIHRLLAEHFESHDLRVAVSHYKAHVHFKTLFDTQRASHQSRLVAAQIETERLQFQTREQVLLSFGVVLEYRDDETHGHTERVVRNAIGFGQALGLNRMEMDALRQGAYLHDIGKLAISDNLLHKPGRFTSEERLQMQEHVRIGQQLVLNIPAVLPQALEVILSHHERWDGAGYGQGLAGCKIPFLARVFSIVDVFDALVSVRPYKTAWSQTEAFAEIAAQAGRQFDPELVKVYLQTFSSESQT